MAKKKSNTKLPSSQGGLMSFGESFNSVLSFSPEAVMLASVIFALLLMFILRLNPFGF